MVSVCLVFVYVLDFRSNVFYSEFITDALFEKKQTIMTYESEMAQYQAQVKELEAKSAEKDTLVAKYEAMVKISKSQTDSYATCNKKYTCTYMCKRKFLPALA